MADLVQMGKSAFDAINRAGQFFFPKIAVGRVKEDSKVEIAQYESEFEQFQVVMRTIAIHGGPIDWIAHTADTYQFMADLHSPADAATTNRIHRGEVTVTELFEEGHPRATEALTIVKINRFGFTDSAIVPYTRPSAVKVQWGMLQQRDTVAAIQGRYIDAMRDAIALSLTMV